MTQTTFKIGDAVEFKLPNGKLATGKVHGKPFTKGGRGGGKFVTVEKASGFQAVRVGSLKAVA